MSRVVFLELPDNARVAVFGEYAPREPHVSRSSLSS